MTTPLDLDQLLHRRVIMVGGKGGVGKSTVAATLATIAAARGLKTRLVSTDPAHNLSDIFQCNIGPVGRAIDWGAGNLHVLEINPEAALDRYLESVRQQMLPYVALGLRGQLEKQLHLTRHSPGAEEAALLDEMTRLIGNREDYDLLIFDTAPTGHTLRLLSLPTVMSAWTEGLVAQKKRAGRFRDVLGHFAESPNGRRSAAAQVDDEAEASAQLAPLLERQRRFRHVAQVLKDPRASAFLFVMTAEKLPLRETCRAVEVLKHNGVPVAGLLLNRLLPQEAADIGFLRGAWECQQQVLVDVAAQLEDVPQLHLPVTGELLQGREGLQWLAAQLEGQLKVDGHKQKQPGSCTVGLS